MTSGNQYQGVLDGEGAHTRTAIAGRVDRRLFISESFEQINMAHLKSYGTQTHCLVYRRYPLLSPPECSGLFTDQANFQFEMKSAVAGSPY